MNGVQNKQQKGADLTQKSETLEQAEKALKVGVKIKTGIKGGPTETSGSNKEWQE